MYKDVRRVRVGNGYFKEFGAGVGVRQGSFLSLLLFINRSEALSREFYLNCPCEMLFVSLFDLILYVPSTIFQLCRTGLPGWNQCVQLGSICLAQGPQRSEANEARIRSPSVSSQALYH